MTATGVWAGRPDLSDIDGFWTAPISERAAGFAALREHEPIPFYEEPEFAYFPRGAGFYALTRHADVVEASRNPAVFTSGQGSTSVTDMPPEFREFFGSMIEMDDPRHARLRRIVSRGFTPSRLGALVDEVAVVARRIVDDVVEKGGCDAVTEIAARLPLKIVCDLMGVPASQHGFVFDRTNVILGASDPEYVPDAENIGVALLQAGSDLAALRQDLGRHRMEHPTDDVVSALVNAEVDGERLTPDELGSFFILLVVAGNETTRNAASGGMLAFFEHPEQWARLTADPSLAGRAAEEIVRWVSPVNLFRRTATRDTEIRGQRIREGDKVVVFYGSANRDEEVFTDPFTFDITRDPNPHVGFGGGGAHFCLGNHLAKLELRVLFETLARRLPTLHQAGEARRLRSYFINGIKSLPVAR